MEKNTGKVVGNTTATTYPIPKKLSDITDDTNAGVWGVNYAKNALLADQAYCDGQNNIITDTYATKKELENTVQKSDLEFYISLWDTCVPYKRGNIVIAPNEAWSDVSLYICLEDHISSDYIDIDYKEGRWNIYPLTVSKARADINNNTIHEEYATKSELTTEIGEALEDEY